MMTVSPERREWLSHPAQCTIGKCWPITAAKPWPDMSREISRAGINTSKGLSEPLPIGVSGSGNK
jgi:hypothetical protein